MAVHPVRYRGRGSKASYFLVAFACFVLTPHPPPVPPTTKGVDPAAGTVAAFYYKNFRDVDLPSRDALTAPSQDLRFTTGEFDKQVYAFAVGFLEGLGLRAGDKVGVWMTGASVEQLVISYAAAMVGVGVVSIDPRVSFAGVKAVIASEQLRTLFLSPRHNAEDRLGALQNEFAHELGPAAQDTIGIYNILASKRFRSLKHIVCTSQDYVEGVLRFKDLPVYGKGENGREGKGGTKATASEASAMHFAPEA